MNIKYKLNYQIHNLIVYFSFVQNPDVLFIDHMNENSKDQIYICYRQPYILKWYSFVTHQIVEKNFLITNY